MTFIAIMLKWHGSYSPSNFFEAVTSRRFRNKNEPAVAVPKLSINLWMKSYSEACVSQECFPIVFPFQISDGFASVVMWQDTW